MFFYILFYINLPYIEESREFRIIQKIKPIIYWLAFFITDCILHTLLCGVYIGVSLLCDRANQLSGKVFYIFILFCFIGYIYILLIYIYIKSFNKLTTIYSFLFYTILASSKFFYNFLYYCVIQKFIKLSFFLCRCYKDHFTDKKCSCRIFLV